MPDQERMNAIREKYAALNLEITWVPRIISIFGEEKKKCEVCGRYHYVKHGCDHSIMEWYCDGRWHRDEGDDSGINQIGLFLNGVYISCVYEYCMVVSNSMIRGYASQMAGDKEGFDDLEDAKVELLEELYPLMEQLMLPPKRTD